MILEIAYRLSMEFRAKNFSHENWSVWSKSVIRTY